MAAEVEIELITTTPAPRPAGKYPIFTSIYAACEAHEDLLKKCLSKTRAAYSTRHFLGIDKASKGFRDWADDMGFKTFLFVGANPPQMRDLFRAFLSEARTPMFFTVEQDVILCEGTAEILASELERAEENVFCISPFIVDENDYPAFPASETFDGCPEYEKDGRFVVTHWNSFNGTVWRTAPIMAADWNSLPMWGNLDIKLVEQLRSRGLVALGMREVKVIHYPHSSQRPIE